MTLLQPSFRGRLRLFFAVIVVVPIIAIGVVLFRVIAADDTSRLDARLSAVRIGAANLYKESRADARRAAQSIAQDPALTRAIEDDDQEAAQTRVEALAREFGTSWLRIEVTDLEPLEAGTPETAIAAVALPLEDARRAAARADLALHDDGRGICGAGAPGARGAGARRPRREVLASTVPAATGARIDDEEGADLAIAEVDYRSTFFRAVEPDDSRLVGLALHADHRRRTRRCRSS